MSRKLQTDRAKWYKLKREHGDEKERADYLARLLKNKEEAMFKMEAKASKLEGDIHRIKEEYRQQDNDRQKKFFMKRFEALNAQESKTARLMPPRPQSQTVQPAAGDVARKMERAASLTLTHTQSIDE
jgi:lipase chaperone LimK